jgi:hypothetical protein
MLDLWGQLNVELDTLAKAYWNETYATVKPFYTQATSGWSIWIGQRRLSSWDRQLLYNHAKSIELLGHWSERRAIPRQMIHSIDWAAGQQAIRQLGLHKSLWIPKWLTGFAPVGKVLQRNQQQSHAECPRCSAFEDTQHVLLCNAPNAQRQWDASIDNLAVWLTKARTLPDLQRAILSRLQSWRQQTEYPAAPNYNWPGVNALILAQDSIGWQSFLEGSVLHSWAEKQQDYYDWLKHRNTGKKMDNNVDKKTVGNFVEHVGTTKWRTDRSDITSVQHARLDAIITHEYEDLSQLANRDRRWFRRPIEVLFTEPLEYKEQWIESVSMARTRFARRRNTSTQAQRNLMRSTFRRTTTQAQPNQNP